MRRLSLARAGAAAVTLLIITGIASASGIQIIPQSGWILPESITPVSSFGTLQNSLLIPDFESGNVYSLPASGGASSIFASLGTGEALSGLLIDSGPLAGSYLAVGFKISDPTTDAGNAAIFVVGPFGVSNLLFQSSSVRNFTTAILAPSGFGQLDGKILVTLEGVNAIQVLNPASTTSASVSTFATLPIEPFGLIAVPAGFGSFGGRLLVSSAGTGTIVTVDSQGNVANFANLPLNSENGLRQMAFAPSGFGSYGGDLFVSVAATDNGGGQIGEVYVVNSTGSVVAVLKPSTVGIPFDPRGLYFPGSSQLYISNGSSQPGLVIATASDFTPVSNGDLSMVSLTNPAPGAIVSGSFVPLDANATAGMGLTIASIQMQIDGANVGPLLTALPYSTTFDSTAIINGPHNLTAVALDSGGNSVTSPIVPITVNNTSTLPPLSALLTGFSSGTLRNNYSGYVGMEFTVGTTPVTVYSLGRFIVAGNTQAHLIKLVQANGTDVPNGSVSLATTGSAPGQFAYAPLVGGVTLLANTSYFLVSQETAGGDQWYDYAPVTATAAASVVGPAYTDGIGRYVPVTSLSGQSYVPVNLLYAPPTTALSVSITSPLANATISGTASITVSTTGPVTSLQVKVNGVNQGNVVAVSVNQGPSYTLSLDTTVLTIGSHSLTVVANGSATSAAVPVTISNAPGGSTAFVLGQTPGPLRNNYSGFVGMTLQVGSTPVVVASLGRFAVLGNTGTHLVKLVKADGTDMPGASVSVSMTGATPGSFQYASLPAPFTLQANTPYFLVSQETTGGDQWYDYGAVVTSVIATVVGPAYTDGGGHYVTAGGLGGFSYVPLSFLYGPTANTLSATISSPQNGALLSGSVPVSVTTTGTVASYQLLVDGVNAGAPSSTSPITIDTTGLSNGQHTLTVKVSGNSAIAVSPGVTVTVNNNGSAPTPFTTGQSARSLRNNYTGNVGMAIHVGAAPIEVVSLGRYVVSGNLGAHVLKLVQANGTDVPGGAATVALSGATAGQYAYAALPGTVTLAPNTTYYLVSQETAGGDMWYDLEPITVTGIAQVTGPTYTDAAGHYVAVNGFTGYSYVPLSFQYQ